MFINCGGSDGGTLAVGGELEVGGEGGAAAGVGCGAVPSLSPLGGGGGYPSLSEGGCLGSFLAGEGCG